MTCECETGCGKKAIAEAVVYTENDVLVLQLCESCIDMECGSLGTNPYDLSFYEDDQWDMPSQPTKSKSFTPTRDARPLP